MENPPVAVICCSCLNTAGLRKQQILAGLFAIQNVKVLGAELIHELILLPFGHGHTGFGSQAIVFKGFNFLFQLHVLAV